MAETAVTPFRWTSAAYDQAVAAGVFAERRVELLGGEIFEMAPEGPAHVVHVMQVVEALTASLPFGVGHIREAHPIALPPHGEPEPDVAVVAGRNLDYARQHPTVAQLRLVMEVSDTTASYDLGRKAFEYAAAGVAHYWVLLVAERVLVTMREPVRTAVTPTNPVGWTHRQQDRWSIGQTVTPPIDGAQSLTVASLFPTA
jgi:Uma2 family endonuclease